MHMKLIIFCVLLGTVASNSSLDWLKYKRNYNKHYKSAAEEVKHKQIFLENANYIRNFQRLNPNATFTVGINHLTDQRIEELVSSSKYYVETHVANMVSPSNVMDVPDSLDWRTKGVISPVKDQGFAGQVGAFVAVEVIESWAAIQTGHLASGSIAEVLDCCPQQVDPFQCITKLGGLCSEADYPTPTGQCRSDKCKPVFKFNNTMRLTTKDENTMVIWIQNSTLFAGIDASRSSFQLYQGGIYDDQGCSKSTIDHAMQIVGYGKTASGELFWICKNSWGVSWGEQGYMRVSRGHNTCGIATYVIQVS